MIDLREPPTMGKQLVSFISVKRLWLPRYPTAPPYYLHISELQIYKLYLQVKKNTQYPVINNFYDHPTDLCGDSLISFQGLMWNSIGFYQNLWFQQCFDHCFDLMNKEI
jgi:hypothetical protein